jgi:hypothetical protein
VIFYEDLRLDSGGLSVGSNGRKKTFKSNPIWRDVVATLYPSSTAVPSAVYGGVSLKTCKSCMPVKYCKPNCRRNHDNTVET